TKGIDPEVKLKDSGIDWLGEIPEGWEVVALKRATKIIRGKFGHRPRNDPEFYNGDHPFIQTGDVTNSDKYINYFQQTLNAKGFNVSQEFPANTLVMTIAANIGDLAILSFKASFPDSIVGFYPSHGNSPEFLYYLFKSMKKEFLRVSTSNTQLNINIDRISPLKIPVPPPKQQTAIVHHIETETTRINTKIAKTKKIIALQKEYRTALISEVVTGKIKVTQGAVA
ncbi:MAG TPA: restriction endonuclease subunit S, partial [Desulfobacterales bacterium]|nr:restriction endonuclease subunit S [Desulfobacterales bacterium]